jgi:hypothetical protein
MHIRILMSRRIGIFCATVGAFLACAAPAALATFQHPFLSQLTGTPAGLFSENLCGVTVDSATQNVYVADPGSDAIDVFSSAGVYQTQISGLKVPLGSFSPLFACSVGVNDTNGDVYIADSGTDVVYVFDASDNYVSTMSGSGAASEGGTPSGSFGSGFVHVAVDQSSGDVYVADSSDGIVDRFNSAGEYQSQLTGLADPWALTVDTSGAVYVAESGSAGVYEFDSSGAQIQHITGTDTPSGSFGNLTGVAVDSLGDVYVTDGEQRVVDDFSPTGHFMEQATSTPSGPFSEPEGIAVNADDDLYVADHRSPAGVVDVFGPFMAEAPSIGEEGASNVGSSNATLLAQIDPHGADTTYHFEYDTSEYKGNASHGVSVPLPGADIGSGIDEVPVSASIQDLSPGTIYHYRVVAHNSSGGGGGSTVMGPDRTFKTQSTVDSAFRLPDGRQYELVSPQNGQGARILPINFELGLLQASTDGGSIAYVTEGALGTESAGNQQTTQVLSSRVAGDTWISHDIETPTEKPVGVHVEVGQEYRFASPSLSLALVEPFGDTPLSPLASERTMYVRDNADNDYQPIVTRANVLPGVKFGGHEFEASGVVEGQFTEGVHFIDATPDLEHIIVESNEALTSTAIKNVERPEFELRPSLYEWAEGQLQLVSVLPNGKPATAPEPAGSEVSLTSQLGDGDENVRHAVSNDGSRVVWHTPSSGEEKNQHLYLRDTVKGETITIDTVQPGASGTGAVNPVFETANDETTKVFFTDEQQLTVDSTASQKAPDLYECEVIEVAGKLTCALRDLTVDSISNQSAHVLEAVLGANEEGSYVYFVAKGVLAAGANDNANNLYVAHEAEGSWNTTFIASLQPEDSSDWAKETPEGHYLTARVSPSGRYLAFLSHGGLTGYDNHDANSNELDTEVYLYDASTARLVCASCDPTGARPVGILDRAHPEPLIDGTEALTNQWVAGSIPSWTPMEFAGGRALYQSRYLSDEGRLFFDSEDGLVPQDSNNQEDVYEYEPEGIGNCSGSSETFNESTGGCVGLISSGASGEESAFLDASTNGDDVFFLTSAKLVPGESDTGYHIYDAHVCGASGVECGSSGVSLPPCTTTEACRQAPSPQPGVFGAPASQVFSGSGNPSARAAKSAVGASKTLTRKQQLARALKTCRKKSKKKRVTCESQARKRYGASKAKGRKSLPGKARR